MSIFKVIKDRWNAETPILAKFIRNLAIAASTVSTSILALASTNNIIIPAYIIKAASWILISGVIVAPSAQLFKKNDSNDNNNSK